MRKRLLFIALFVALVHATSGCAFNQIRDGLGAMKGQHIQYAIDHLGYPDGEKKILDKTIYVWGTSFDITTTRPVTTNSTGSVYGLYGGYVNYYGTSTTYVPTTTNYNCTIEIITNKNGIIVSGQFNGNLGGCSRYGSALQKIASDLDAISITNIGPEPENSDLVLCRTVDKDGPYKWATGRTACAESGGTVLKVARKSYMVELKAWQKYTTAAEKKCSPLVLSTPKTDAVQIIDCRHKLVRKHVLPVSYSSESLVDKMEQSRRIALDYENGNILFDEADTLWSELKKRYQDEAKWKVLKK